MKKNKIFLTLTLILSVCFMFTGCQNQNETLAKNLDNTVTNLIYSVSSLDWADSTSINQFLNNSSINNDSINQDISSINLTKTIDCENCINCEDCTCPKCNNEQSNTESDSLIENETNYNVNNEINSTSYNQNNISNTINNQSATHSNSITLGVVTFATQEITDSSDEVQSIITKLITKRAKIQLLIDQLYGGKINLTQDDVSAINAYMNIIKENTSYLNSNKGIITNQLSQAKDLFAENSASPLINAYIIRTNEVIETRLSKLSSSLLAIDSICEIIENGTNTNINQQNISNVNGTQTQTPVITSEISNKTTQINNEVNNNTTSRWLNQRARNQYFPPYENINNFENINTNRNPYINREYNPYAYSRNNLNYNQYQPYINNSMYNQTRRTETINQEKIDLNQNEQINNNEIDNNQSSPYINNQINNRYSSKTSNQNLEEINNEIDRETSNSNQIKIKEVDDELLVKKQKNQEEIIKNQTNIKSRETKQELQKRDKSQNIINNQTNNTSNILLENKQDENKTNTTSSPNQNNETINDKIENQNNISTISNFLEDKEKTDPNLKTNSYFSGGYVMNRAERVQTMPYRNY